MFWRDITLSVWRKKTTCLKTKKRLLPLVLAAALCSSPVWAEEATFTANFKDTDLKSFIETVGANLNKTIIMGPGVQGKVSIRTMTPLNERQYYQLFLNLLEAQGYAVVPMENDVLKVVKSSAAKVEPLPLVGEGSDNYAGDEMVTKVVPVRNVSVRELAPALPSRRTGCPFLAAIWLAMRNGLSAASMNAGDGAPGGRWLRLCSSPSSMSRIYRFH